MFISHFLEPPKIQNWFNIRARAATKEETRNRCRTCISIKATPTIVRHGRTGYETR
jgi:hypothetical protein